jgi:hypothetical protein
VSEKILNEKTAVMHFLEMSKNIHELMYLLTGHKLAQGEQKYEPIHIDTSEAHRSKIVKELTPNELALLENDLDVLGEALSSLLDVLDKEWVRE